MTHQITFTTEVILPPALALPGREVGACVEFLGLVRETEGAAALSGLHYEAYESMAVSQLEKILRDLELRFECQTVEFIHRLGWVPVGEASIFVRVLASHRGPALGLCGALIDRMKEDVPIWKRLPR